MKSLLTCLLSGIFMLFFVGSLGGETSAPPAQQYAPDRKADITHVIIDITPDFSKRTITGCVTLHFQPIARPLEELSLSARDLTVDAVTASVPLAGYTLDTKALVATFSPPIPPGQPATLTIQYHAEPKKGLNFHTPEVGYQAQDIHLFTQGEPHSAPYWFPNYDYPNERSTSEVICHVPPDMCVLSNGTLISEDLDTTTGLKAVRWRQDIPHVNYLVALAVGHFQKIESSYRDIPLAFYTLPSVSHMAEHAFRDTADMMAFFENEIGVPFPWNKYDQVVIQDFGGGMENTTLTVLEQTWGIDDPNVGDISTNQGLIAHELAHSWFGNDVTCKDWSHIWLNEGFATYYEKLYEGYKHGHDSFLYSLYCTQRDILGQSNDKPIVNRQYQNAWEQFDYRTYGKGGWVLHMLRVQLGEELFRRCVKTYLTRYALTSVVTEDFNAVLEELTGRSFDRFFDQWVYHAGYPNLKVTYEWQEKDKLARISVSQTQDINDRVLRFELPTKIRFIVNGTAIDQDILIQDAQHDFYFALPGQPAIVQFDPEYGLLAKISFELPKNMLLAQLKNPGDALGRLVALEGLGKFPDQETVQHLQAALTTDPFYAVRIESSKVLRSIHTEEAFAALLDAADQEDARVRCQVVRDIGEFYRPESLAFTLSRLEVEKNPEILHELLRNVGRYQHPDHQALLTRFLEYPSWRNRVAAGAIVAIRRLGDRRFIAPLKDTLARHQKDFAWYNFTDGLDALAYIASEEDDKSGVCDFLTEYVNHPYWRIQRGALNALGTLGYAGAIPVVETFANSHPDDPLHQEARNALDKIQRQQKIVPEEIIQLRQTVDTLRQDNEKLHQDLEGIKKRLDAKDKNKDKPKHKSLWPF